MFKRPHLGLKISGRREKETRAEKMSLCIIGAETLDMIFFESEA